MKKNAAEYIITPHKTTRDLWMDIRLSERMMNHLWDNINNPIHGANNTLAGNISKSMYIHDKDNRLYESVLKELTEYAYYKDWNNYYEAHIVKTHPPAIFQLRDIWANYQKQHEFNPIHHHEGLYSFVVFMKIPTHWKEQHALPISANSNMPLASNFEFVLGNGQQIQNFSIYLGPEDEGRMLFFPAWLTHLVYPFYECEEERITISGNIDLIVQLPDDVKYDLDEFDIMGEKINNAEATIKNLEAEIRSIKEVRARRRDRAK